MNPLPRSTDALVIRTDFSDDEAWTAITGTVQQPVQSEALSAVMAAMGKSAGEGFRAYVELLDDPAYNGLTVDQLIALAPEDYEHSFLLIVDDVTVREAEHPLLAVDLLDEPGRCFRLVPTAVQSVENNLSIANMDFAEFAEVVDDDGIFRGMRR